MPKEETEEKKEETKTEPENIIVVKELPVQPTTKGITEDGKEVEMITTEEALTEIYNDVKAIKKAVA